MKKLLAQSAILFAALTFQVQAAEPKETKTLSGIGITMLKEGSGANPRITDTVKVNYRGTLENGQEFDSSYKRGQPATFPLSRVIPCWTKACRASRSVARPNWFARPTWLTVTRMCRAFRRIRRWYSRWNCWILRSKV